MDWDSTLYRLKNDKGRWGHIARTIHMHPNGLRRIATGETPTPRLDSVQKIQAFYALEDAISKPEPQQAASQPARKQMQG